MLSVLGARRVVWPVGDVTITARIDPSDPVTIWLTVPRLTPADVCTLRPVVSPGSAVPATAPRASTLLGLACAIPLGEACSRPWLLTALVVGVVGVVVV